MREEHIKKLSEKYKSGTSSLKEEKLLFEQADKAEATIKMWSTFVKKNKNETPENFNEDLWGTFEKKTKKTNYFRIGLFSAAASLVLLFSIYGYNSNQNELTNSEKEALLMEAKSMFTLVNVENEMYNIIVENELVVVYTKSE
jgi:hypothetical protein